MDTFHHTDTLGQAITTAVRAASSAADALDELAAELAAEREMHRAEVMRLVERAEQAEQAAAEWEDRAVRCVERLRVANTAAGYARY